MTVFLLVEDSPTIRSYMAAMIGSAYPGSKVVETDKASVALGLARTGLPDVVLVDMVHGSTAQGLGVVRGLLSMQPPARIVVVTALPGDDPAVVEAVTSGVVAVVRKPIGRDDFLEALKLAMEREIGFPVTVRPKAIPRARKA